MRFILSEIPKSAVCLPFQCLNDSSSKYSSTFGVSTEEQGTPPSLRNDYRSRSGWKSGLMCCIVSICCHKKYWHSNWLDCLSIQLVFPDIPACPLFVPQKALTSLPPPSPLAPHPLPFTTPLQPPFSPTLFPCTHGHQWYQRWKISMPFIMEITMIRTHH